MYPYVLILADIGLILIITSAARFGYLSANLATFHVKLLLKFWFGYLSILATFRDKVNNALKPVENRFDLILLCFDVYIFAC